MPTGTPPRDLQALERWEQAESRAPLQVSRVLVVEAPLSTSTLKLLQSFADMC